MLDVVCRCVEKERCAKKYRTPTKDWYQFLPYIPLPTYHLQLKLGMLAFRTKIIAVLVVNQFNLCKYTLQGKKLCIGGYVVRGNDKEGLW